MVKEDNKLKPHSCKVKNNMETILHMNEFKFHKPGKWKNKNLLENKTKLTNLFSLLWKILMN